MMPFAPRHTACHVIDLCSASLGHRQPTQSLWKCFQFIACITSQSGRDESMPARERSTSRPTPAAWTPESATRIISCQTVHRGHTLMCTWRSKTCWPGAWAHLSVRRRLVVRRVAIRTHAYWVRVCTDDVESFHVIPQQVSLIQHRPGRVICAQRQKYSAPCVHTHSLPWAHLSPLPRSTGSELPDLPSSPR